MELGEIFEAAVKKANKQGVKRFPLMTETVTEVSETTCTTSDGVDDRFNPDLPKASILPSVVVK